MAVEIKEKTNKDWNETKELIKEAIKRSNS